MEVGREREWKATEEEEAAAVDAEELGGLQIRQKKKGKMGRKFEEREAKGGESEDQHSVYLDADKGVWKCRHCTWTYNLSGPGIDLIPKYEGSCQVVMKVETLTQLGTYTHSPIKGADVENCTVEAKEFNDHKDVPVEEHNGNLRNVVVENGSNSHLSYDKKSENGFTRNDNEIQEQAEHTPGESSTFVVEELDIERVLSEQENNCSGADVENVTVEAKEFNGHKDVPVEEHNGNLRNVVVENGSNSHLSYDEKSGNGFMRNDNEIQEQAEHTPGESSTFVVEELDVERVLREQETYDLICPKCRSCITKRVILRKRKRAPSQSGLPPPKAQNVSGANPLPTEPQGPDDTAVFRCLSCFSFFIPTETGCNILRVFWKKSASDDTQSSENKPARTGNWVTSCFGSDSSLNEDTEAGSSTGVSNSIGGITGNQAQGDEHKKPAITVSEGLSTGVSNSNGAMGNQAEGEKQKNSSTTVSEGSSTGVSNSNGGITGNQALGDEQNKPALTVSEDVPLLQETRDPSMGSKENSPPMSTPGITNHGENGTPIGKKNVGSSTGVSISNGGITGNQAQGDKKKTPAITVSEGNTTEKPGFVVKPPSLGGISQINGNINNSVPPVIGFLPPGNNIGSSVGVVKPTRPVESTNRNPNIGGSEIPATGDAILDMGARVPEESPRDNDWDVLKSIVYGGLFESITSLGVVSSAAGTGSSTLNICALGLANLIGGLFVIAHDISEMRSTHDAGAANQRDEQVGRYWEKLGQRKHFRRHTFLAILSYIIFGLLPPVVYGFAFRVSDNKEYKLIAVAATSMLCVALLAIGKAHVRSQKDYIVSLFYYLGIAVPVSGLSYVAGVMIDRLLVELGLFNPSTVSPSPPSSIDLLKFGSGGSAWASI